MSCVAGVRQIGMFRASRSMLRTLLLLYGCIVPVANIRSHECNGLRSGGK